VQGIGESLGNQTLLGGKAIPGGGSVAPNLATTLGDKALGYTIRAGVTAGVNQLVYGKEAGSFKTAFTTSLVSSASADAANWVGDTFNRSTNALGNIAAHGLLGCAAAAATGKDCAAGAAGAAASALLAPGIDALTDVKNPNTRTAVVTALSMIAGGLVADALGKDVITAAAAAQNEVTNNYLKHPEVKRYTAEKAGCETRGDCAAIDAKYRQISQANEAHAQEVVQAAKNCTTDCAGALAELRLIEDEMAGGLQYTSFDDKLFLTAQISTAKAKVQNQVQQQWCADNKGGCAVAIASPLFPALAAAAPALAGEAVTACIANPAGCTATINSIADGLLADGAVGAAGLGSGKVALERLATTKATTQTAKLIATERPMEQLVEGLMGKTLTGPALSKTAQTVVNDGKLGEQLGLQVLKNETGRAFRQLQNASNNGADGVAIVLNADGSKTIYLAEVKSSINGVDKAGAAEGSPAQRLETWAKNVVNEAPKWQNMSVADKVFATEIKTLIDRGVEVKGIQVQVGIPASNTSGTTQIKISEWK
ncbi:MAG: hypothetical protein EG825_05400, partial [Rhodocyclaceae bacterium]|nr:hypothetical protein [Rhodocyclaceae bacterium]